MIKINLLESITDRPATVAFVEDKVSSTRTQTFLLALTVLALLVLGVGYDYVSANAQHLAATKELAKQRSINERYTDLDAMGHSGPVGVAEELVTQVMHRLERTDARDIGSRIRIEAHR